MITCAKEFHLTVNSASLGLAAYWTLNEAVPGPRIDSVSGLHLNDNSFATIGVPALFSDGIPRTWNLYNGNFDTLGTVKLAYGGANGFSLFGWFKINAICNDGNDGPKMFLSNTTSASEIIVEFGNTFGGQSNVFLSWQNGSSDQINTPGVTLGAWHFFHVFYDPVLQKVGISLDNGANTYTGTLTTFPAWVNGEFQIFGSNGTNLNMIFDEIGIKMSAILTPAQVTFLYNGGSGRTWPV